MGPEQPALKLGPIEQVVLQSTPACNLNCNYCYLSESSRRDATVLPISSLGELFEKILSSSYVGAFLDVVWHAGEPLVLTPDYYRQAISAISGAAAKCRGSGFPVKFYFQTNGTLIDQRWCDFFNEYTSRVFVGISCDGPRRLHDLSRKNWGNAGSFDKTRRGMQLLSKNGIPFGLIAVVTAQTLDSPDEFYDFFLEWQPSLSGFHFNLIEGLSGASGGPYGYSGTEKYYAFVRGLLKRVRDTGSNARPLEIQNFSWAYDKLFGSADVKQLYRPESMSHPFKTLNLDVQGDVSTFYAGLWSGSCADIYGDGRGLSIGNLFREDLDEIARSPKLRRMADDFTRSHRACAESCEYSSVCSGGFVLAKYKQHGTFEAAETTDCRVSVKTFIDAILDDIREYVDRERCSEFADESSAR